MNTRNCMDRLDMSIIFLFLNISLFGQVSYNCSNAIKVCDNEIITISYKRGEILNLVPDSLENACGTLGYIDFEYHFKNAVWLKYQFESNGKFIFKITPEDPYTDLDFAVFESNNNDCTNLEAARCMFSGINLAFPEDSEICLGETGLSENFFSPS